MKFLAFVDGLVFGALLGAVAGLLLAPQPGDELQSKIRERYDEVMNEGRRAAAERRAELEAQFAEAKRPARPESA
jgi:gas vesicle protein